MPSRQCYWTSERVNRSLTSLINANDPLAPLLKRIAAADDDGSSQSERKGGVFPCRKTCLRIFFRAVKVSFIPIATSATSAPAATKSVMMIIVVRGERDERFIRVRFRFSLRQFAPNRLAPTTKNSYWLFFDTCVRETMSSVIRSLPNVSSGDGGGGSRSQARFSRRRTRSAQRNALYVQ